MRLRFGPLSFVALVATLGCDPQQREQSSSSTHWVACASNADCASHPSHPECDGGYCVNSAGERLPKDQSAGGRQSSGGATGSAGASATGGVMPTTNGGSIGAGTSGEDQTFAGSSGSSGVEPAGGQGGSSGRDCDCRRGGTAPVCGVDGNGYDAVCGDECVPVAIACRGQCPCALGEGGGGSGGSGGSEVEPGSACSGTEPYIRPDLDRSCQSSSDCFVGRHLLDCCGTTRWLGYNNAARADFDRAETGCVASCPCPQSPTQTEDGLEIGSLEAAPECIDGVCMARHPDAVGECLAPGECIDLDSRSCITAEGPLRNGICRGAGGLCNLCECTSPETPIATPAGYVPISELRVGDLVYSVDGAAIRAVPIAQTHRKPVTHHEVVEVRLASGELLAISAAHPIADGRTFADLTAGARLGDTRITRVKRIPYSHRFTYDVLPGSDTGIYFAAGVALGSTLRAGTLPARTFEDGGSHD